MSSTTNVQNLLVNVFRPTSVYDPITTLFQVKLDMSNVNTVFANDFYGLRADIGDSNNNMYVGVGSGNPIDLPNACSNNTVLGVFAGAGMSNVTNSTYLGYTAGQGASNADQTIAIGAGAVGNGLLNLYIGNNTGGSGDGNLFIGHAITAPPTLSNTMYIGLGGPIITGKFAAAPPYTQRVGLLESNPQYPVHMGTYTFISNGLGINADPAAHTLNVNGDCRMEDGFGLFQFDQNQVTSNSFMTFWSYTPGKSGLVTFGQGYASNPVYMGINTPGTAGGYNLDVSGTLRVQDPVGGILTVSGGTTRSTSGFSSVRGTTASLTNGSIAVLGTWKKGINIVAATGPAGSWSGSTWIYDGTTATNISINQATITVSQSGTNIQLSNTSAGTTTFGYNITYLPTP